MPARRVSVPRLRRSRTYARGVIDRALAEGTSLGGVLIRDRNDFAYWQRSTYDWIERCRKSVNEFVDLEDLPAALQPPPPTELASSSSPPRAALHAEVSVLQREREVVTVWLNAISEALPTFRPVMTEIFRLPVWNRDEIGNQAVAGVVGALGAAAILFLIGAIALGLLPIATGTPGSSGANASKDLSTITRPGFWTQYETKFLGDASTDTSSARLVGVSEDGQIVAFTGGFVPWGKETPQSLYVLDANGVYTAMSGLVLGSLSPDGSTVAFLGIGMGGPCLAPVGRNVDSNSLSYCTGSHLRRPADGPVDGYSYISVGSLSLDDRYLAFASDMTNWLYPPLSDRASHVYLLDQQGEEVAMIDRGSDGSPGTCSREFDCTGEATATVADDGGFVVFDSPDSDLVPGDTNNALDVFLWRRSDNSIALVSVGPNGQGSLDSRLESISGDGRFILFSSSSPNLTQNDANGHPDVFLRDTLLATTKLVSVGLDGHSATGSSGNASVSRDGRYVAFISDASDLTAGSPPVTSPVTPQRRLYVRDLATQETYAIATPAGDLVSDALLSADGRTLAYVVDPSTDTTGAQAKVIVARTRP